MQMQFLASDELEEYVRTPQSRLSFELKPDEQERRTFEAREGEYLPEDCI